MAKTIAQLNKAVKAKLQTLKLTQVQAITAIGNKAVQSMERIQDALRKKVEEVHDLNTEFQELMFEQKGRMTKSYNRAKKLKNVLVRSRRQSTSSAL